MQLSCHRCGADLPGESVRGFCAVCGAPQLVMGEMPEPVVGEPGAFERLAGFEGVSGGGMPPPPMPSVIRWPLALRSGAMVAGGAALAFVLGSLVPAFSLVSFLLIFGSAGLSLALYRRAAPESLINGTIGARIGLTTGLLLLAALTLVLAAIGVMARFRLHAMSSFDAQWAQQLDMLKGRTVSAGQGSAELAGLIERPEFRAWSTLASVMLLGVLLLGLTTGSGALVGSMGRARRGRTE